MIKSVCLISDGHDLYDDRMYWKLAISLQKKFKTYIVVASDNIPKNGVTEEGITYFQIQRERKFRSNVLNFIYTKFSNKVHRKMFEISSTLNADLYIIEDPKPNDFILKLMKKNSNAKYIYDTQEPIFENSKVFFSKKNIKNLILQYLAKQTQKKEYKLAKKYNLVITVDDGLKRSFEEKKCSNCTVIYNYTPQNNDREFKNFDQKKYDAIYCGGITEIRGFFTMINSVKTVAKSIPNFTLLLLGSFYDTNLITYLKKYIIENNLEKNIIWQDFVRFDKVKDYYNESKIALNILYPCKAFNDIIQIKIFEYMNFGLPIITSNFGEMQNYILDNKVGVSINPYDEKELSEKIILLLQSKTLYSEMSQNGINAVDEKYKWSFMEEKLFTEIEKLSV